MEIYTSDSSDSDSNPNRSLDFSYMLLEPEEVNHNIEVLIEKSNKPDDVEVLILHHNHLRVFPENIVKFTELRVLDISNNNLTSLPDILAHCQLSCLMAKNNNLKDGSLPKTFTVNATLKELNLSGNLLTVFPEQLLDLINLKYLYLGGNHITSISKNIWRLQQ